MSGIHIGLICAIPYCGRPVMPEWALSLATQNWPMGLDVTYMTLKGLEVGVARNKIAEQALEHNAKYVWFVDDDTAPPTFAARKLFRALEEDKEAMVCGGIYCSKGEEPEPIVFRKLGEGVSWDWKIGEVFPCEGLGTGCMMIRTEVFRRIDPPWFVTVDEDCPGPSVFEQLSINQKKETDDLFFCRKLNEAGMKILAHGGVLPIHWDIATGNGFTLPMGSLPTRELCLSRP